MKLFAITCIAALLPFMSLAESGYTRSFVDKVSGGSLTETNDLDVTKSPVSGEGFALELKRVEFRLPTATLTNVFSIIQSRKFVLPEVAWTRVSTNLHTAAVTTNTYYRKASVPTATFIHTNSFAATTNNVSVQVFDGDDFGWGMTFEQEDVTTFSFTETNDFYMIRVYDVYPRP